MFSGTTACGTVPAGSVEDHPSDGARPRLSLRLYDTKCPIKSQLLQLMASMLIVGMTNAAPVPRAGQMKIEFGGDAVTQVGTAAADHAVGLGIRAPSTHFATSAQLGFGQTRLTPRVREPRQAVGVVAMHPVAQRLAIHSTGRRQQTRMLIRHQGHPQNAPRRLGVSRPRCLPPQLRNPQILACNLGCRCTLRESTTCRIEPHLRLLGNPQGVRSLNSWYNSTSVSRRQLGCENVVAGQTH
jgi:hypothetical protein